MCGPGEEQAKLEAVWVATRGQGVQTTEGRGRQTVRQGLRAGAATMSVLWAWWWGREGQDTRAEEGGSPPSGPHGPGPQRWCLLSSPPRPRAFPSFPGRRCCSRALAAMPWAPWTWIPPWRPSGPPPAQPPGMLTGHSSSQGASAAPGGQAPQELALPSPGSASPEPPTTESHSGPAPNPAATCVHLTCLSVAAPCSSSLSPPAQSPTCFTAI